MSTALSTSPSNTFCSGSVLFSRIFLHPTFQVEEIKPHVLPADPPRHNRLSLEKRTHVITSVITFIDISYGLFGLTQAVFSVHLTEVYIRVRIACVRARDLPGQAGQDRKQPEDHCPPAGGRGFRLEGEGRDSPLRHGAGDHTQEIGTGQGEKRTEFWLCCVICGKVHRYRKASHTLA